MKNIVIAGAGGFGREVYCWIKNCSEHAQNYNIVGFIDDNLQALNHLNYPLEVISTIQDYNSKENEYVVVAIGDPNSKRRVVEYLLSKSTRFETIIHPTAVIGQNVRIGHGTILCPNSILTCDISLGNFVIVNCTSGVGHDATIGNYSTLSAHVDITGHVHIGERVLIGSHATVLPNVKVQDDAVIGSGSVVVRNVKKHTTVFGNPAKVISVKE